MTDVAAYEILLGTLENALKRARIPSDPTGDEDCIRGHMEVAKTPPPDARQVVSRAAISSQGSETFRMKLEKHLSDRVGGRTAHSNVPKGLFQKRVTTSELIGSNTRAFELYTGALTLLPYDQRARFVNGVADASRLTKGIGHLATA